MKLKYTLLLFLLLTILLSSCRNKEEKTATKPGKVTIPEEISGKWHIVKQFKNSYILVDCGYEGEIIQVYSDSVSHKGIMEDANFKINHSKQQNSSTVIYPESTENNFYKFEWINRKQGIAKWEIQDVGGSEVKKYAVHETGLKNIKKVKGTKDDCMTGNETAAASSGTYAVNDTGIHTSVENGNCLTIRNNLDALLYEHCFDDGSMIETGDITGPFLPITFYNGPHSMIADFYNKDKQWVAKSITFYKHTPNGHVKQTKAITVTLADFDFGAVMEEFE